MKRGVLVFLFCAGCSTAAGPPEPQVAAETKLSSPALTELEGRLASVEKKLAGAPEGAAELRRERLLLYVAITALERQLAQGAAVDDVSALLADAQRWIGQQPPREVTAPPPPPPLSQKGILRSPRRSSSDAEDRAGDASGGVKAGGEKEKEKVKEEGKVEQASVDEQGSGLPPALMTAVQARLARMEACLGDIDASVEIQVALRLVAGGTIRAPRVSGVAPAPAACIADVLKAIKVPDYDGGTQLVQFPLFFEP